MPRWKRWTIRKKVAFSFRSNKALRMPTHDNRCYVKLAWIGLVAALALPGRAEAEIVAPTTGPALLAVTRDGSPRVAFVSGRDLVLARRGPARWTFARLGRVPGTRPVLAGLVVDGRGRSS